MAFVELNPNFVVNTTYLAYINYCGRMLFTCNCQHYILIPDFQKLVSILGKEFIYLPQATSAINRNHIVSFEAHGSGTCFCLNIISKCYLDQFVYSSAHISRAKTLVSGFPNDGKIYTTKVEICVHENSLFRLLGVGACSLVLQKFLKKNTNLLTNVKFNNIPLNKSIVIDNGVHKWDTHISFPITPEQPICIKYDDCTIVNTTTSLSIIESGKVYTIEGNGIVVKIHT